MNKFDVEHADGTVTRVKVPKVGSTITLVEGALALSNGDRLIAMFARGDWINVLRVGKPVSK